MNYLYKDFAILPSIKDVDGKKGIVTGYFSHFDSVDADGDIIRRGAFSRTIKENGPTSNRPRIKHLFNHDPSQPLGVLTDLKEDTVGLAYESRVGTHNLGRDFVKMVDSGLITEHSIGFQTIKKNQLREYDEYRKDPSKGMHELTELKLWEGSSLSAWGANPMTPVTGMKSEKALKYFLNKSEAIDKFCKDSDATDETIELLLIYNQQLSQVIEDLKTTQPAVINVPAIVPESVESNEESKTVKSIPDTANCPSCHRLTYNTQVEKGYIKCHRCESVFCYGSNLFVKI